jgi:hypothetical protein
MRRSEYPARRTLAYEHALRDTGFRMGRARSGPGVNMSKPDAGFDYDRYRRLLAEANDEPKRLAFINILIDEKAKENLARQSLRKTLAGMGITKPGPD